MQRRGPLIIYLAAMITLVGCVFLLGWTRTWSAVFVPAVFPPFADMRLIQGAVISAEQGAKPRMTNPKDLWQRRLNYPLIWIKIGKVVNLQTEARLILFSSMAVLFFGGVCAYMLYCFPSWGLLASVLSTATLFGIERGNIDLIMYCLVFLSALLFRQVVSPVPILVASALKIYPVFALVGLLIKKRFRLFFTALIFALGIFAHLGSDLAFIRSATPIFFDLSYGLISLNNFFSQRFMPSWMFPGSVAIIFAGTLIITLYLRTIEGICRQEGFEFNLFIAGSSIYVGTFIFSTNYDYRLIYLIFCVPFLQIRHFPFSGVLVILVIVAMNQLLVYPYSLEEYPVLQAAGLATNWFAKLTLFATFSAYLSVLVLTVFDRDENTVRA